MYFSELKEAFLIYDQDRDQKVNRSQATDIIRSIGLCPTDDDLVKMLGESMYNRTVSDKEEH